MSRAKKARVVPAERSAVARNGMTVLMESLTSFEPSFEALFRDLKFAEQKDEVGFKEATASELEAIKNWFLEVKFAVALITGLEIPHVPETLEQKHLLLIYAVCYTAALKIKHTLEQVLPHASS